MATGDIRKGIDNLTKSKSNTFNRKQLQEIEREKLRLRKKGIQDEEQLERKAIDNIEKYRDSKRRQSLKELFQQEKEDPGHWPGSSRFLRDVQQVLSTSRTRWQCPGRRRCRG